MAIKENFLVEKKNILNEIRANNMTLQELRFFIIYLSKINARDLSTRVVRFPISDFQKIMEFGRLNIKQLSATIDNLLCKIVKVPKKSGGFTKFQLFKQCTVDLDGNGEWYVEIDAHDKALPLMFELKNQYFSYQIWNILRLKSTNHLRMYEILKQYETVGERILSINELKDLLGIDRTEYERFNNFKQWVLNSCKEALAENTDIKFTYEPYGKRGKSGKVISLKFKIEKNENHAEKLTLGEFIQQNKNEEEKEILDFRNDQISFLMGACENEFSELEIQMFADLMLKIIPFGNYQNGIELEQYSYLQRKYTEMIYRSKKTEIRNRFAYLRKIIEADFELF